MSDRPNEITPEMIFRVAELHRTIKEQVGEIERLTSERDALLACRQGEQRCQECPDKLELPAIPDDAVVDLFGCLIDVTQPQCQACKDTGRITISVGGTAMLSNVCECVNRDGKQRE